MMEFDDSPPLGFRQQRAAFWRNAVKELQAMPGQWGKVGEYSPGIATQLRKGKYSYFLDGKPESMEPETWMRSRWDIHAKKLPGQRRDEVWIRWNG